MTTVASPLIHPAELRIALEGPNPPVLLDVRWTFAGPDRESFARAHIPGALFVDLDAELASEPGLGGRHPLPDPAAIAALCTRAGLIPGRDVVVTGERDTSIAARAWWLLRWIGVPGVRILDGGVEAWQRSGGPIETGPGAGLAPVAEAASSQGRQNPQGPPPQTGRMPVVDADGAAEAGRDPAGVLLDARAPERYRGDVEPVDPVPGHIPGAVNLPLAEVHAPDGTLLPAEDLRDRFRQAGVRAGTELVASCGSGVTACSLILAAEVAGFRAALYPGSYSGWCALGRPVARIAS